ncbi:hypothetical protein [Mycoplasma crocodyli]|nr:hypothetical protein [Mycoplasma crocodyli]
MYNNKKWYTQDNYEVDNGFFEGFVGIIFTLNKLKNKKGKYEK